jgi:CubicO group peptidase (beta-lactamase class C family)
MTARQTSGGLFPFPDAARSRSAGSLGAVSRTSVGGAPALSVDFHGSKYAGQLLFVDYGKKTYIVEMSSDPSEFDPLRDRDFSAILSSWHWQ